MSYMRDWRGRRLDYFDGARGLATVLAWFDDSTLSGANGAAIPVWADVSGNANDVSQSSAANRPTVILDGLDGRRVAHFGTAAMMNRSAFGSGWPGGAAYAMPFHFFALARIDPLMRTQAGDHVIIGSGASMLLGGSSTGTLNAYGTTGGSGGGPIVTDDQWHMLSASFDGAGITMMVDADISGISSGTGHGAPTLSSLAIGGTFAGNAINDMDVAEWGVVHGRLSPEKLGDAHAAIREKWGLA